MRFATTRSRIFMLMLAERRGRSVLCINSAIDFNCVEVARSAADDLDEAGSLTVLLNSPGGDIESAYRMLLALRDKAGNIEVLVPERAKSAAVFFLVERLDDTVDLYGPAPQTAFMDPAKPSDRLFQLVADRGELDAVNERLEREAQFDSDLWIVAIEDRKGRSFLKIAPA